MTEQNTEPTPGPTDEQKAIARKVVAGLVEGKIQTADMWAALTPVPSAPAVIGARSAPVVPEMSEKEKVALARIHDVYASVVPLVDRALSDEELAKIVEERDVIDTIIGLVEKRKSASIRETLANHLDHILDRERGEEGDKPPVDKNGHYLTKQEVRVSGTGRKVQKSVTNPKPSLSMEAVQEAHENGLIDRKTYLAITKQPEVPRVLDEDGLAKAIKKDPSLLFTLAPLTKRATPTITIKVLDD